MSQGVMQNKSKFFFFVVAALFFAIVLFVFQVFGGSTTKLFNMVRPGIVAVYTNVVVKDVVVTDGNSVTTEVRV
jgi:hypothetical protein